MGLQRRRHLTISQSPVETNGALRIIELRGGLGAVPGIRLSGIASGIKKRKPDLALIAFDDDQHCVSMITTNEIKAAPLLVSEEHLEVDGKRVRALVCNA